MEDDEIAANALTKGNSDDESKEEDGRAHSITLREAFNALDISLQWLESQGTDPAHLLFVKKWSDTAAHMRRESLRQTDIFTRTD